MSGAHASTRRWSYAERRECDARHVWKEQESMIRSVVFDVGETLIDDTREWARWADWLNVPLHTFSAVLGAVTAEGRNNAETFDYFRPGFDLAVERQRREDAGRGELIEEVDLYSDVRPGLQALRDAGLWVGIAGNQTARAGELLQQLNLPVETIATSGEWGWPNPTPVSSTASSPWRPGSRRRSCTWATTVTTTFFPPAKRACGRR